MPAERCPVCGLTRMIRVADKVSYYSRHAAAKKLGKNGIFIICEECMKPLGVRTRVRLRNTKTANPPLPHLRDGDEGTIVAINGDSSAADRATLPKSRYDTETEPDLLEVEFNIPRRFIGRAIVARAQLERLPA